MNQDFPLYRTIKTGRHAHVDVNGGRDYLTVQYSHPGCYDILSFSGATAEHTHIGFELDQCAKDVENRDFSSDAFDCFRISDCVKVGEVVFSSSTIKAEGLEAIRTAAQGLAVTAYHHDEL